ncbi:protein-tyrosine phosphatase family protein [Phenylobacterium deserti]|uniref:Protein phosphatase n=1 Tax=Phenylobacterium deserti TaxID=1914756 RepID=A0A328AEA0_9CAUL|nr:dual specificity protein phosphatase family protein [Phenylobacterium deserti]RAK52807.1 protein phosphatase [Phenylobacterium deserti]
MPGGWTPNLSWITPDLAVGGSFPAGRAAALAADHGVGAVIDVRSEACDDPHELEGCGIRFLHLPTFDHHAVSQSMLDAGVAFAADARREGRRLLIHCEHGIGRSATVALCVLVDRGMGPMEALSRSKDVRELVSPSPAQYEAWTCWLGRSAPQARVPTFDAFKAVAYRHLTAGA